MIKKRNVIRIAFALTILLIACSTAKQDEQNLNNDEKIALMESHIDTLEKSIRQIKEQSKPRLADVMFGIHGHYVKLWFTVIKENWKFAQYEIDKMKEGFATAREMYPTFQEQPVAELIPKIILPPLDSVQKAIDEKNKPYFMGTFNVLTNSCNYCHSYTRHEFNVIKVPQINQ